MAMRGFVLQILVCFLYGGCFLSPWCHACTMAEVDSCVESLFGGGDVLGILTCPQTQQQCLKKLKPSESVDKLIKVVDYMCSPQGEADTETTTTCISERGALLDLVEDNNVCVSSSGWNASVSDPGQRCTSAQKHSSCLHEAAKKYCAGPESVRFYDQIKTGFDAYGCFKDCSGTPTTNLLNIGTLLIVVLGVMMASHFPQLV